MNEPIARLRRAGALAVLLVLAACSLELTSSSSATLNVTSVEGTMTIASGGHRVEVVDGALSFDGEPIGTVAVGDEVLLESSSDGPTKVFLNGELRRSASGE